MQQVLLLNSSYEPLHICSWQRAMILALKGKAIVLEVEPNRDIGAGHQMPLVVRLLHYVKIPHKDIPLTRKNIMHRDNYTCQYCGCHGDLTIDHVIPRSKGGKDRWDNVVAACLRCNVTKSNRTPKQAGMPLAKPPVRPHHFITFELSKQAVQTHTNRNTMTRWQKYMFWS